jgi:hypothetical protein
LVETFKTTINNAITGITYDVEDEVETAIFEIQTIAGSGSQFVASQIPSANKLIQYLAGSIDTPQAQECLSNGTERLSQINNTARK